VQHRVRLALLAPSPVMRTPSFVNRARRVPSRRHRVLPRALPHPLATTKTVQDKPRSCLACQVPFKVSKVQLDVICADPALIILRKV
jgi:hypothetical protein